MFRLHQVQTSNVLFRLQMKVQNKDTQFHIDKSIVIRSHFKVNHHSAKLFMLA